MCPVGVAGDVCISILDDCANEGAVADRVDVADPVDVAVPVAQAVWYTSDEEGVREAEGEGVLVRLGVTVM